MPSTNEHPKGVRRHPEGSGVMTEEERWNRDYEVLQARLGEARAEIARLKRGDFTPEEFQALCHHRDERRPGCSLHEFAEGCHFYQRNLFGKSEYDHMQARAVVAEANVQRLVEASRPFVYQVQIWDHLHENSQGFPVITATLGDCRKLAATVLAVATRWRKQKRTSRKRSLPSWSPTSKTSRTFPGTVGAPCQSWPESTLSPWRCPVADLQSVLALRASEPRRFDAEVAAKVFEQSVFTKHGYYYLRGEHGLLGNLSPAEYHSSAEADYAVLVHVRERWSVEQQGRFRDTLCDLWSSRTRMHKGTVAYQMLAYQPGDYSACALVVMEERTR